MTTAPTFAPAAVTDAQLQAFCDAVNAKRAAYWTQAGYTSPRAELVFERGPKNARLILSLVVDGQQIERSAYGFVDLSTGYLLKAAGWKGPAKGVRGHVDTVTTRCGIYSIA